MESKYYDVSKSNLSRRCEHDVARHTGSKSETRSILPPIQPDILFHTSEMKECLTDLGGGTTKKAGAFFYQFRTDEDCTLNFLPEGCVNMLFECGGKIENSRIIGIHTKPEKLVFQGDHTYFGVKLYSTFGLSNKIGEINELVDQVIQFKDMFSKSALADELGATDDFERRMKTFQMFYQGLLDDKYMPGLEEACARILCMSKGNAQIAELEEQTNYTKRYIQQKFVEHYGVSPKLYGMIKRFQSSMVMLLGSERDSSFVAQESGYYDQSHFIKEFRRFVGASPDKYKAMIRK